MDYRHETPKYIYSECCIVFYDCYMFYDWLMSVSQHSWSICCVRVTLVSLTLMVHVPW